jgi:hypothetical protein
MPLKNFFTWLIIISFVYIISFSQDNTIGLSGSEMQESHKDLKPFDVLLKVDLTTDGYVGFFTGSLLKKINNSSYWISRGNIENNSIGKEVTLISFEDKIINTDGKELISQVPAEFGYIVSFSKNYKGIMFVSISDKDGNSISDELQLIWNKENNKFEILNF